MDELNAGTVLLILCDRTCGVFRNCMDMLEVQEVSV